MALPEDLDDLPASFELRQLHVVDAPLRGYLGDRRLIEQIEDRDFLDRCVALLLLVPGPGELHQLPVLHLGNLVLEQGIARPAILAAGLPIEETLEASKQLDSTAIVLSATMPPAAAETRQWITACIEAGWADRIILAGAGFMRSRVYADFPVRAAAGDFAATVRYLSDFLNQQPSKEN